MQSNNDSFLAAYLNSLPKNNTPIDEHTKQIESSTPEQVGLSTPKQIESSIPKQIGSPTLKQIETTNPKQISPSPPKQVKSPTPKQIGSSTLKQIGASTLKQIEITNPKQIKPSPPKQVESPTPKETGSSTLKQIGSSTLKQIGSSTLKQIGSSTLKQIGSSKLKQIGPSTPKQISSSTPNVVGKQIGPLTPKQIGSSTLKRVGSSTQKQISFSTPKQTGSPTLKQVGSATRKQIGSSIKKIMIDNEQPFEIEKSSDSKAVNIETSNSDSEKKPSPASKRLLKPIKSKSATELRTARNVKSNSVLQSHVRWRPKIQLSRNHSGNRPVYRPQIKQKEIMKSKTSIQNKPFLSKVPDKKIVKDVPVEEKLPFCAILGCQNQKTSKPPIIIHPFPRDEEKRELWVQMTGRKHFKPDSSSFVCGKHFDSSDYSKDRHTLDSKAIPSRHLPDGVMQIEYIEDIDEESFQILMNGTEKPSKRKNSEEINHNWKIPKPNEQESRVAMEKFRELYTTQEMVAMKILRYKQDFKKYTRLCSEADELKAALKKKRQSQNDKSKLLHILDGISKKESTTTKQSTDNLDSTAEQIVNNDEELIEMLPSRYTEEVQKFSSNLYTFNPDAYVYLRHTLRTLLPDVEYLKSLAKTGFKAPPAEKVTAVKLTTEMTENCLNLKIQVD